MPALLPDPNSTQLPQPLPTPGPSGTTGNPVLDEIHQAHAALSPPAQQAIAQAHNYPAPLPQAQPAMPAQHAGIAPLATASRPSPLPSTTLQNEGSGISQIHNPWARIPLQIADAVGGGFFPKIAAMLPGTELHHQMLVNEQRGNEAHEQAADLNQAKLGQDAALTGETNAKTETLLHPPDESGREALQSAQTDEAKAKAESLRNPPEKQGAVQHVQDDQGNFWLLHPDGTAQPVKGPQGTPLRGKQAAEKTASPEQQYLDEYRQMHPGSTIAQAEKQFKTDTQAPERAPQIMMMVPGQDGSSTAQIVRPGQTVGAGAVTPAAMSANNKPAQPTSATRTMAETAPRVMELADRVGQLIDEQTKSLGPAASRWSEFMAGKVGAPNPEFTKLRTDVGLLQTALMRMHVGARGGEQIMEHFKDLIDTSKQSPENLKAALGEIQGYARQVAKEGQTGQHGSSEQGTGQDPHLKAYADKYFGGDINKATAAIAKQQGRQ